MPIFLLKVSILLYFFLLGGNNLKAETSIDNDVIDEPKLECGAGFITLRVRTKAHFMGRLFLKSMASSSFAGVDSENRRKCEIRAAEACTPIRKFNETATVKNLTKNNFTDDGDLCSMKLSFDGDLLGCPPLQRQRSLNPHGVSVIATILVSFHPLFITKIDRMYRLQCFYHNNHIVNGNDMSMITMVRTGFHVSGKPTSHSTNNAKQIAMPICRYEILDNINGKPIGFSTLSGQVYHRWLCETKDAPMFCFRVHSCYARATAAHRNGIARILDYNGCAVDKFLLPNLNYSISAKQLEAGQLAQVYKYAEIESLYFQCQIKIWRRKNSGCPKLTCREPQPYGRVESGENDLSNLKKGRALRSVQFSNDATDSEQNPADEGDIDVEAEMRVIEDLDNSMDVKCLERENFRHVRHVSNGEIFDNCNTINFISVQHFLLFLITLFIVFIIINIIIYQALLFRQNTIKNITYLFLVLFFS